MDEAKWLAFSDPTEILHSPHLRGRPSERKLRLFACACGRCVWHLLEDERSTEAVRIAEHYADGEADESQLRPAWLAAHTAWLEAGGGHEAPNRAAAASISYASRPARDYLREVDFAAAEAARAAAGLGNHSAARARLWAVSAEGALLRDLFGNLFRPVAIDPAWRTPTVTALAAAAYENRLLPGGTLDPDRLAVLSDALEEAGCDSERGCQDCIGGVRMSAWEVCRCETCGGTGRVPTPLFAHLRGPGPHVRGCWVVDLLLGRE